MTGPYYEVADERETHILKGVRIYLRYKSNPEYFRVVAYGDTYTKAINNLVIGWREESE